MPGSQDFAADPRNAGAHIYLNGALVSRSEARVSIFDAGFVLGDGIWEGLRLHNGALLFLDTHLDRLFEGARAIALDIGMTRKEVRAALEETLAGRSSMSQRVMLQVEHVRASTALDRQHVLNDAVVNKSTLARMIELELFIDGDFVCRYRADGLVVATPTGSTAYSLSAGGPIVHPAVEAFIITPICPHTLTDRPVVVRDSSSIELKLTGNSESVFLTLDGQKGIPMQSDDRIRITRSPQCLKLIQPPKKSYFEILRNKLKWGEV